jgi:hypothetical protein
MDKRQPLIPRKPVPAKSTSKRLVSAPRSKTPKSQVKFVLETDTVKRLDEAAAKHHRSRPHLLACAVDRCLHDDIWLKGQAATTSSIGARLNPSTEMVELCNVLVALAFNLGEMQLRNTKVRKDQAARNYIDAKARLEKLRVSLGC